MDQFFESRFYSKSTFLVKYESTLIEFYVLNELKKKIIKHTDPNSQNQDFATHEFELVDSWLTQVRNYSTSPKCCPKGFSQSPPINRYDLICLHRYFVFITKIMLEFNLLCQN